MLDIIVAIIALICLAFFVLYNRRIVQYIMNNILSLELKVSGTLGKKLQEIDAVFDRDSKIRNKGAYRYIAKYFDDILIHLGLKKEGVTVTALVFFIALISLCGCLGTMMFIQDFGLLFALFFAYFYMIMTMFRLFALTKYEKMESILMETQDLIAMDADQGVKNAIVRYVGNFHPAVRPYFETFIDDIERQGYSFKQAMNKLNFQLGSGFSSFARSAIQFESRADETMKDIFSPIVDANLNKRNTREITNKKFSELRIIFLTSVLIVFLFAGFMLLTEMRARYLLLETTLGRISLVVDILVVVIVLAYITSIKAKLLR